LEGNISRITTTGSTLLDLAISGGRVRGGGLPSGIFVEAFGPNSSGKTVLLSEIAGAIQRQGGELMFKDPEARFDKQFAKIFGFSLREKDYETPDTVPELFKGVRNWDPKNKNKKAINGIFADSLAALSTDLEMGNEEGDKMGQRRAKEFSEQLRKTCRILKERDYLMVCTNQIRTKMDAGKYDVKVTSPGGFAFGFYASVRLRFFSPKKIKQIVRIAGKEVERTVGITTVIEVFKNSVWKPYQKAPVTILFDYGIDDVRENLQFIKDYTKHTTYTVGGESIGQSMDAAIKFVEEDGLEKELKEEVIDLWEEIESKFESNRKKKQR